MLNRKALSSDCVGKLSQLIDIRNKEEYIKRNSGRGIIESQRYKKIGRSIGEGTCFF